MNQRIKSEDVDSPLCAVRPVKTVLVVSLTGDRGLCGGYNNFIIKKVRSSVQMSADESVEWQREREWTGSPSTQGNGNGSRACWPQGV